MLIKNIIKCSKSLFRTFSIVKPLKGYTLMQSLLQMEWRRYAENPRTLVLEGERLGFTLEERAMKKLIFFWL
jgi:hypothetical protein